ncbi:PorP/SprF family type IX secretion system membrane protein [Prolixibacteraceae bacterium Z1-6]|uniref:PorP/SprF family type IX secretion system membrane protein n=1 Tax=Draconibacterium aestuarii TaxID=2998507 RepID=A0A9X3J7X0_9BACT|nr:PorP/SprF family type IX secretion system membrane protein [Prolixibacteraceae bacterium Z1-6]
MGNKITSQFIVVTRKHNSLIKRIIILGMFVLLMALKSVAQQEPILTSYMFNGQVINPAYAGMWEKIGFTTLVRKQWAGIDGTPLTEAFSFHTPFKNDAVGIGLNIMNDRFALENRLSVLADYSYEVYLTPRTRMRMGIKFGFINYKNLLTQYKLYPDNKFDRAYESDVNLKFLPNFGFGVFIYQDDYYMGFSIPRLVENDLKENFHNYSTSAEVRTIYLSGGYVFPLDHMNYVVFKPTILVRATWGTPPQTDLAANFLLREQLWLGVMFRTGSALCFTGNWIFNNNLRVGFAIDVSYNEIYPYQNGTFEFTVGYDIDFFGRRYLRSRYF